MNDDKSTLDQYLNLEEWLYAQPDEFFPDYNKLGGEKSYTDKYRELKQQLIKYHEKVEKGALLQSIVEWKRNIIDEMEKIASVDSEEPQEDNEKLCELQNIINHDPAIYLNQHGTGHVDKVIQKVMELIKHFKSGLPTASEIFLLLCAIQVHDVGNIFGREDHEKSFQKQFINIVKPIILDTATRKCILKIAQVHSGNINGSKDTITQSQLRFDGNLFDKKIREPVLAALLRFGDELADDFSRADLLGLELDNIPEESLIYHEYSKALQVVKIENNEVNKSCFVNLEYYIESDLLFKEYNRNGMSILLLDEIFSRTKKMEQERRYCMRFLSTYLPLIEIRVRIEICSSYDLTTSEVITYTLKEDGYPLNNIMIDYPYNTAEKVINSLIGKGWRLEK